MNGTKNKAGRPKATAKHMAVFMARLHFTEKLGRQSHADRELMELFGVSEDAVVRRMVSKAAKTAKRGVTARLPDGRMIWFEGAPGRPSITSMSALKRSDRQWVPADRQFGMPIPTEGGEGWVWCEGMKAAVRVVIRNVQHSVGWNQAWSSGLPARG